MLWRGPIGGGAASGKMGALIASRARTTQYLKARVNTGRTIPTALQAVVRNAVSFLVTLWSGGTNGLSEGQRNGWEQYALNVPKTNRLGDSIHVAGVNWFIGNNTARVQLGEDFVKDAPVIFNTGDVDLAGTEFVAGGTLGTLTLVASPSGLGLTASDLVGIWVSPAFSPGRAKWYGQLRLADSIPGNSTASVFIMPLPFGDGGTNSKYQANIRISREDGRLSSPFVLTVSP